MHLALEAGLPLHQWKRIKLTNSCSDIYIKRGAVYWLKCCGNQRTQNTSEHARKTVKITKSIFKSFQIGNKRSFDKLQVIFDWNGWSEVQKTRAFKPKFAKSKKVTLKSARKEFLMLMGPIKDNYATKYGVPHFCIEFGFTYYSNLYIQLINISL